MSKELERKLYKETHKYQHVPDELKQLPTWVCYRFFPRPGSDKLGKMPYNPTTGDPALANDPSTWTDFNICLDALKRGEYDGIGFQFAWPYFGVDLDDCRNRETGEIQEWAQIVVAHLDSYTEPSPSGTGIHVIGIGKLPPGGRRVGRLEMYDTARFFTVTGDASADSPTVLEDRTRELSEIHAAVFCSDVNVEAHDEVKPRHASAANRLSNDEIITRASGASNGVKFQKLWRGEWNGDYPSHSNADAALCCHLAFWTANDEGGIDELFRLSGLFRKKWNRKKYREGQLRNAVAATSHTYALSRSEKIERIYSVARVKGV